MKCSTILANPPFNRKRRGAVPVEAPARAAVSAAGGSAQAGGEPFEEKMPRLVAQLREQQVEAARLDAAIADNLKELGFWEAKA